MTRDFFFYNFGIKTRKMYEVQSFNTKFTVAEGVERFEVFLD